MDAVKKVKWQTNYNGKLDCTGFIHLDILPAEYVPRSIWENTVYEIECIDGSHETVKANLIEIHPIPFNTKPLGELITLTSHGMLEKEFVDFFFERYKHLVGNLEQIGIYYYKKIA